MILSSESRVALKACARKSDNMHFGGPTGNDVETRSLIEIDVTEHDAVIGRPVHVCFTTEYKGTCNYADE